MSPRLGQRLLARRGRFSGAGKQLMRAVEPAPPPWLKSSAPLVLRAAIRPTAKTLIARYDRRRKLSAFAPARCRLCKGIRSAKRARLLGELTCRCGFRQHAAPPSFARRSRSKGRRGRTLGAGAPKLSAAAVARYMQRGLNPQPKGGSAYLMTSDDTWRGKVHVYDYRTPVRLHDCDGFKVAEAFIHHPFRSEVALCITVAVTGPATKRAGFAWERAFADGRTLRDRLVEERRALAEGLTENAHELHFLP